MTCIGTPPQSIDAMWAAINTCATAYGGADWPSLALTGLATVVVLVFAVLLAGALVARAAR